MALRVDKVDDYFHQTFVQFLTSFINGANNGVSCASGKHECLYFFSCKQFLKTIDTVCLYLFSLRPFTRMGRDVRCRVRLSRDLWTSQKNVFCQYNRGGEKAQRYEERELSSFRVNGFQNGASEKKNLTQINRLLVFCSYTNYYIL